MRLANADRPIEHEIVLSFNETDILQFFPGQRRRELYAAVFIALKCFIGRKAGPLDKAVALVLLPAGNFLLKSRGKILDLLWRAILLDQIRDRRSKEQGPATGKNAFFLLHACSCSDHDAIASFPSSLAGRNA